MNRDERQDLCIEKWKENKGKGIMLCATGFGKTFIALKLIKRLRKLSPELTCLIAVPGDYLKEQWDKRLIEQDIENVDIKVINTAVKQSSSYDFLVCDEVHMFCGEGFIKLFDVVKHKYFLGLTATIDRLDGREKLLLKKYPIIDTVTLDDAIKNKWVSDFIQYKVVLNVDLEEYLEYNAKFLHHFSFFDYDFNTAINCLSDLGVRINFSKITGHGIRDIMIHAMGFSRSLQAKKSFIYNHLKKIDLANLIINNRKNRKILTFTKTVEHAKLVCCGEVYHYKLTKKTKDRLVQSFNKMETGVMHTCKSLDMGADIEGVDTAIIMSGDSSNISKKQKIGRAIRFKEGRIGEVFTFVIKGTTEENWFSKSNKDLEFITVQDYHLEDLLKGNELKELPNQNDDVIFTL